jgi:hypothetical protein
MADSLIDTVQFIIFQAKDARGIEGVTGTVDIVEASGRATKEQVAFLRSAIEKRAAVVMAKKARKAK